MRQVLKISSLTVMFFILFGFFMWSYPPSLSQLSPAYSSLTTTFNQAKASPTPATAGNESIALSAPVQPDQDRQGIRGLEPALLFLFGIGMVGFLGLSRRRLYRL